MNLDSTRLFRDRLPALLVAVNEHLALDSRFECGAVPCDRLDLSAEYQRRFGELLAAVYEFDIADALPGEFGWFVSTMSKHGFGPAYSSRMLEAWSLAVVSSLSSRAAAGLTVPIDRLRRRLGVLLEGHPKTPLLSEGAAGFLDLLLQRRRRGAAECLISHWRGGQALEAVVNDVVLPALTEVGLRWQRAQVTVADEHAATAICWYAVLRLFDSQVRSSSNGRRALVCCAPGEEHELGAELVGEYLDLKGWDVFFVGRSSPQDDTLKAAASFSPDSVFISVTIVANLPAARELVTALRQAVPGATVVLGGRAAVLAQARLEGPSVKVVARFDEADSR